MNRNLVPSVALIMRHEGGYVNHPSDPGGCTNHGITIGTYRRLVDPRGSCGDLKSMPAHVAEGIYEDTYWGAVKADSLPDGVDLSVFDMGVNAGPHRAARLLQSVVGTAQDGIIGPMTLDAVWALDAEILVDRYAQRRLRYYRSLRNFSKFGRGWTRRVEETRKAALEMARKAGPAAEEPEPIGIDDGAEEPSYDPAAVQWEKN